MIPPHNEVIFLALEYAWPRSRFPSDGDQMSRTHLEKTFFKKILLSTCEIRQTLKREKKNRFELLFKKEKKKPFDSEKY